MNGRHKLLLGLLLVGGVAAAAFIFRERAGNDGPADQREELPTEVYVPRLPGTLTFNRDIAPVVHRRCSICHRPGEAAPFSLISYADVAKHARQVVEITRDRTMPPWLPKPGHGDFADSRRLSTSELGMLSQWIGEGAVEGDPGDKPRPPEFVEGWQLGTPDLVVTMPEPYMLRADGEDVYRNFVIPVPTDAVRYVQAMEFRPGNPRVVHHSSVRIDITGSSQRLDAETAEPGFDGMEIRGSATSPPGHFIAWQPGRAPRMPPADIAWTLRKGADLVIEAHLRPSGKIESLQCSVGLYFTEKPATKHPVMLALRSLMIDIPAGEESYPIEDSYVLPVDVQLLGVSPHAHYLCKRMEGFATMPDGRREWLVLIENWDFNWQGEYRYNSPVHLPAGTRLDMRYTYDNSLGNIANPNDPPKRVRYGLQSADEMGELVIQALVANEQDFQKFRHHYSFKVLGRIGEYNEKLLGEDPGDLDARVELGRVHRVLGRTDQAIAQFDAALALDGDSAKAHYELGKALEQKSDLDSARREFGIAIDLDPLHFLAHHDLGLSYLHSGNLDRAEKFLLSAVELAPGHVKALSNLGVVYLGRREPATAKRYFERALEVDPAFPIAKENLRRAKAMVYRQ